MSRHIHIHLPQRTHDAGWEEGKHPRRNDGKFGTKEGDAPSKHKPGTQEYHHEQALHHSKQAGEKGARHPDTVGHVRAATEHAKVARELGTAKKPTKAETLKAAKAEYAAAGQGKGNYAKAAEMFEAAGDKEKAAGATALAKRYGHDREGQEKKAALDIAEAKKERAAAAKQPTPELRALSEKLADAYEQRSKDPESNKLTATINGLKDELAEAEHEARK